MAQECDAKLGKTADRSECTEWTGAVNTGGYAVKWINGKCRSLSRYVWESLKGPIPKGMCVCHRCDNRRCINIDHLFLATHSENMRDMILKGRQKKAVGERHGLSVLTEDQVRDIRRLYAEGMRQVDIKNRYPSVSKTALRKVVKKITWKHIT